jgi:hypothetical protein
LLPNTGGTITITGVITDGIAAGTQMANSATISSDTGDSDSSNNIGGPAVVTVENTPPIAVIDNYITLKRQP